MALPPDASYSQPGASASAAAHLRRIRSLIPRAMLRDQEYARRVVASLESRYRARSEGARAGGAESHGSAGPGRVTPDLLDDLAALEARLEASAGRCRDRARLRPPVSYPHDLPITARAPAIIEAIRSPRHRVVIIAGETGCGKSTQIPKMCLEAGRGIAGLVGCTQPRRIAAITIAYRIAEEFGEELGRSVGYKIRFQDRTSASGYIKIMTDGILLAETQGDRLLNDYDTIIIDEAHERTLNIDFLLGILRRLLDARPDLKLIITSATLDTEKFSQAFRNAPVIEVSGRLYPVEVEYRAPEKDEAEDKDYVGQAVEGIVDLRREKPPGDILVFMPTEQDILETCRMLEGRKLPNTTVLPLFSRLPAGRQRMVYTVTGPKIVVATNVAETSLTISGIRYVVDTGVARIAQYQPGTRIKSLPISPISRASADQRKGRCGRVREGLCVRLYSEAEYEARDRFTQPEILRSDLAEVILRMLDLRLGAPQDFPFIDRPAFKAVRDGYETLLELGAIRRINSGTQYSIPNSPRLRERGETAGDGIDSRERRGKAGDGRGRPFKKSETSIVSPIWALTDKGRLMARMPLDPRISRMLIEARRENCLSEVAVLAAALSIRDPRERPPDQAAQADAVHAAFRDPHSDFLVLLNIWNRYHGDFERLGSGTQRRKFCHDNFLSFPRMREWTYLHEEIGAVLAEQRLWSPKSPETGKSSLAPHADISPALYAGIHRAILAGFLSNIAAHKEKNLYSAAKNREVMLWPGSVLFNKAPGWVVATEMVRTSRLFGRQAARIDPAWLEELGGPLCKRSYSDAAWDRARGEVVAKERVALFGLEIVRDRRVSYGHINPSEAHEIFVMSGLVEGKIDEPPPFLAHNLALQRRVEAMEEKLRRRDIMVPEAAIAKLYSERLPLISDVRSLRKLIKDRGSDKFLRLTEDDLLSVRPDAAAVASFPDTVEVGGRPFAALYKFAPGEDDDGVTLTVPASLLSAIPPGRLEWGVPGLYKDKIVALIKGLPKRYRKLLVPVAEKAETIAEEMPRAPEEVPLSRAVAEFVRRRFGADIPPREWALAEVPKYLRMRVAVTDPVTGRVIETGRDVELLRKVIGAADTALSKVESPAWQEAQRKWEKTALEAWTFGDVPEKIAVGTSLTAYPALVVEREPAGESLAVRLFPARAEAEAAHCQGVRWLLLRKFAKELAFVRRYHKIPAEFERAAQAFGGREAVERAIEAALAREVFERAHIRTEADYRAYEASAGRALFEKGHALTQATLRVLELMLAVRMELGRGGLAVQRAAAAAKARPRETLSLYELSRLKEPVVPAYYEQITRDLDVLVPPDFLEAYPVERLIRLPRYIEALKLRLERARIDPEKDRAKSAQVEPYASALERLQGSPDPEKRRAVEDLRWMIEEFKVSLFAPEIKTAFPISAVRLARKIKEIEAMV